MKNLHFLLPIGAALALLMAAPVKAADLPVKAPGTTLGGPYPSRGCGAYYGLNALGGAQPVSNAPVGTNVIQGDIGLVLGYTCVVNEANFVFVEGLFDWSNLNGGTNGFSLTGPAHFEQRFAFGGPIGGMLNLFPSLNFPAVPSIPVLPAGVTAGPQHGYIFAAIHEQDVSASFGFSNNREWLISPGLGVGMLSRLNNGVVVDVWAEAKLDSQSIAIGPGANMAPKLSTGFLAGFALKY